MQFWYHSTSRVVKHTTPLSGKYWKHAFTLKNGTHVLMFYFCGTIPFPFLPPFLSYYLSFFLELLDVTWCLHASNTVCSTLSRNTCWMLVSRLPVYLYLANWSLWYVANMTFNPPFISPMLESNLTNKNPNSQSSSLPIFNSSIIYILSINNPYKLWLSYST